MTTLLAEIGATDFGAGGGDAARGADMDLSTCVNRYGPAPAALSALRRIQPSDILLHPDGAAEQMVDLYRWATDVRYGAMIAGRGVGEFLRAMSRELEHHLVRIPLPAYSGYLNVFPGRGFSPSAERVPSVERLDAAMAGGRVVVISNPHDPTGIHLDPDDLVATAAGSAGVHPRRRRVLRRVQQPSLDELVDRVRRAEHRRSAVHHEVLRDRRDADRHRVVRRPRGAVVAVRQAGELGFVRGGRACGVRRGA